jgi:hypothetical protein
MTDGHVHLKILNIVACLRAFEVILPHAAGAFPPVTGLWPGSFTRKAGGRSRYFGSATGERLAVAGILNTHLARQARPT